MTQEPGTPPVHPEFNKTVDRGSRKARVDHNRVPNELPIAVFKHTHYLNRWYYDGYSTAATVEDAIKLRDEWLNG